MSHPLRLALVSAFPPGRQSLNEYGLHLAREFAARADVAEVIVLADRLDAPAREMDLGPKIRVERVWRFNRLSAGPAILRALKREGVDAVLWNLQMATFGDREAPAALGLAAPMLARLFGWKSGVLAHNIIAGIDLDNTQLRGKPLRQALVRAGGAAVARALTAADYVTVPVRSHAETLSAQYPQAAVHHLPQGTFDTVPRETAPLADRPRRIVTMGKFGTNKRLETLLAAFDLLRAKASFADYELVIGGTDHPGTPGYVDGMAAIRANDAGVRFHGYVAEEDIADFFCAARLSVFDYSATTGSSGVLHQTASYGAVPVFPHIGDFVDVSRDEGLSGYTYAANDAADMARAMEAALADLGAAQAIGNANRRATLELPLADVAAFHIARLRSDEPQYGALVEA